MGLEYNQTCSGCLKPKSEHSKTERERCSKIKKAQYDEYIKTPAYQNEQAALKAAKKKQEKANQVPFAPIFDKRGVPSRINFL